LVDNGDSDVGDDNNGDPCNQGDIREDEAHREDMPTVILNASPPSRPAPQAPPSFDMIDFLHKISSFDLTCMFLQADALPPIPVHVGNHENKSSQDPSVCK
jgi:hypothetical protein